MKTLTISILLCVAAAAALADGFHSPLLRNQEPRKWAATLREQIGLDRTDSAEDGLGDPREARAAVPPLVDFLRYLDRRNVILREFPDFNYDDIPGFKSETEAILIAIGRDAVPLLVRTLTTDLKGGDARSDLQLAEDFIVRVTRILVAIGEDAVDGVMGGLADPHPAVQKTLLDLLRKIVREPDFGADLAAWRRWHVIFLAGRSRNPAAVKDVLPMLADPDRRLRLAAVRALGELRSRAAVEALRPLLVEPADPALARETIRALVKMGDEPTIPLLIDLLSHPKMEIREEASTGLLFLARVSMGFDPRAPEPDRVAAIARWRAWWEAK
ncbi:MAG: HEAT repeat domain-containing protein [Planctomycetes bacterium]|jgi:HEAT repeat protein|nr:HEAT repeat domain-containing protein [Planctomycetota bacterium]